MVKVVIKKEVEQEIEVQLPTFRKITDVPHVSYFMIQSFDDNEQNQTVFFCKETPNAIHNFVSKTDCVKAIEQGEEITAEEFDAAVENAQSIMYVKRMPFLPLPFDKKEEQIPVVQ